MVCSKCEFVFWHILAVCNLKSIEKWISLWSRGKSYPDFEFQQNQYWYCFFLQLIKFIYVSFDIKLWKCGVVIKSFGDFFADEYQYACVSNAFNFLTSVTVQNLLFILFMVLIDTWYESTQLIFVQLEHFTLSQFLFVTGLSSNWFFFSGKLSSHQGELDLLE